MFRFWSDKQQSHFFTKSTVEKDQVINWPSTGTNGYDWKFEGEAFQVYESALASVDAAGRSAVPVYRLWLQDKDFNSSNGLQSGHCYTANLGEYDSMAKLVGISGEGVAFYGEFPGN